MDKTDVRSLPLDFSLQDWMDAFHFSEVEYRLTDKKVSPLPCAWRNNEGFPVTRALYTLCICLSAEQIRRWKRWGDKTDENTATVFASVNGRTEPMVRLEVVGNRLYCRGDRTLIFNTLRQIFGSD